MKKRIEVYSFGCMWGIYPSAPNDFTLQFVIDVRGVIEDPVEQFGLISGSSPEVKNYVLSFPQVQKWLTRQKENILEWINYLRNDDSFEVLRIYFMCRGGFQRSVALAEEIAFWLAKEFKREFKVTLYHLTKDLAAGKRIVLTK